MSDTYDLIIATSEGKERRIKITNANFGLSTPAINAAIANIVYNDIFNNTKGHMTSVKSVQKTTVSRTTLF